MANCGKLRRGDKVIVISGGNKNTRPIKGSVGAIMRFVADGERVIVEGVNLGVRHQRPSGPNAASGRIRQEQSVHVSNVMYYAEKEKQGVRLQSRVLEDGRKVRGYTSPETREFVQIDH